MSISFESQTEPSDFGEMPRPQTDKRILVSEFEGPAVGNSLENRDRYELESIMRDFGKFPVSSQRSSDVQWGSL